jgi:gliding-associated putative ABC transporter substrate-binding component GldG
MKNSKRTQSLIWLAMLLAIVIVINLLGSFVYTKFDLTEDKRFTMMKATNKLLSSLKKDTTAFTIEIYLEGEFSSEFRHLQNATRDLLNIFRERSGKMIDYRFLNPLQGNEIENKEMQQKLAKQGIIPLEIIDKRQAKAMLVFPSAVIRYGNQIQAISLIELGDRYYQPSDIDPSINFLEYKFATAIQKLKQRERPRIVLMDGHGELQRPFTNEFEKALFEYYDIARLNLSEVNQIDSNINLVIVQKPQKPFSYDDQFKIDQYVMNGGRIIWMIDGLNMEDDSIRNNRGQAVPFENQHDLQKLLFNYGARINANLVASFDAAAIVGLQSGQGQKINPKWFYYPLAFPFLTPIEAKETGKTSIDHPIVKNMDFVLAKYAASIDTVKTKAAITKIPLLRSSKYSRVQYPPTPVSLDIIDPAIKADAFTKGNQTIAVLLEGNFESFFRNRLPQEVTSKWAAAGNYPIKSQGSFAKMIVISDGDMARNDVYPSSGKTLPLGAGFHPETGPRVFANKEFLMNSIEYLLDDSGLIEARSKEIKLRPLDQERAFKEETKWQMINLGVPLVVLIIFGVIYSWRRNKRFSKS